jgi:hypothetical protein
MKYQIVRHDGQVQEAPVGDPESGWVMREWMFLGQAKAHARIKSRNYPNASFDVKDENGKIISTFVNGEEIGYDR